MGIGGSIFLIAVGAILAFAVHASLGFVSIQVVGWVLMAAWALALILTIWLWNNRRRTTMHPLPADEDRVVEQREVRRY